MAKGTLRLTHGRSCSLHGSSGERQFDYRGCSCGPRVTGRVAQRDSTLGHLAVGWKQTQRQNDLAEFEDKLHDLRDPNRRRLAERSPLLRDWYAEWIVEMDAQVARGNLAPGTVRAYRQRWNRHINPDRLSAMPINAITSRDLRQFVNRRVAAGLSLRSANELLTPVSGMLTDAEIDGWIEVNPARVSRRARHGATQRSTVYEQLDRKPHEFLEIADARALLLATPVGWRDLVLWPLVTGARRAEMLGARDEDVRWASREVQIHYQANELGQRVRVKASRKREVVLWSGLEQVIARRGRRGFIFALPNGRARPLGSADKYLREALEAIGLRGESQAGERQMLWHALRHTYATYLRSQGVRWEAVEYMMGHRLRDTTGRYVHLVDADKQAVEDALTAAYGDLLPALVGETAVASDAVV